MGSVAFKQVDVFTAERFRGNPVAVILDGADLTTDQMQRIANWTNLSETTFVLPATDQAASYRVRIFTPNSELPFAGHPTIGTAHAVLEAGIAHTRNGLLSQQCEIGLVSVSVAAPPGSARIISFELPSPKFSPLAAEQWHELKALLGCDAVPDVEPQVVDVGPRWLIVQLATATEALALRPDFQGLARWDTTHRRTGLVVFGAYPSSAHASIEVRAFAPASGINEDPVCGSGNGCVAAYIRDTGQTARFGTRFRASQGGVVGRNGLIHIDIADAQIKIGGHAVTCIDGRIAV